MDKSKLNYFVDMIALFSFFVTAITGALIFFFLPPGEGQRGAHNTFLGYGRHDWGAIHDWAGIIMIVAALAHIVLHWDWIICMTKNMFKSDKDEVK